MRMREILRPVAVGTGAALLAIGLTSCKDPATITPNPVPVELSTPDQSIQNLLSQLEANIHPSSEAELWANTLKLGPIMHEFYCKAFPGCVVGAPTIKILSSDEYSLAVQNDDPTRTPPSDSDLKTNLASTLSDGTIIINTGQQRLQDTLKLGALDRVAGNMPTLILHEKGHGDANTVTIPVWSVSDQTGNTFNFDQVRGFGFEDSQSGIKFTRLEEGAAVFLSQEVQRRVLGFVQPDDTLTLYGPYLDLLTRKMNENGVSADMLVKLHRQSDIDGFLTLIYPGIDDAIQRRKMLLEDFMQSP